MEVQIDLGTLIGTTGGLASIVALGVAFVQTRRAKEQEHRASVQEQKADQEAAEAAKHRQIAAEEREKTAELERYLEKLRWMQLRSLGEQIAVVSRDGKDRSSPTYARLYSGMLEEYRTTLALLIAARKAFQPSDLRDWVQQGRFTQLWQVEEAAAHLDAAKMQFNEDGKWVLEQVAGEKGRLAQERRAKTKPRLDRWAAEYMLIAHQNREFMRGRAHAQGSYTFRVLFGLLAEDECERARTREHRRPHTRTWGAGSKSVAEQFEHYQAIDYWVIVEASDRVLGRLDEFRECFESTDLLLVSKRGLQRLAAEQPEVFRKSGLPADED